MQIFKKYHFSKRAIFLKKEVTAFLNILKHAFQKYQDNSTPDNSPIPRDNPSSLNATRPIVNKHNFLCFSLL